MAILCKPAIAVPEYIITMEQTLELCQQIHAGHPQLDLALRLLQNTGIRKRHIVLPVDEVLQHRGFEERNSTYEEQSKRNTVRFVHGPLKEAEYQISVGGRFSRVASFALRSSMGELRRSRPLSRSKSNA
jgi:1,3,6,8-tetrahydroxynaphthalene synthase